MPPDAKSKEMLAVYWLRMELPDCPFTTKQGNPAVPVCKKKRPVRCGNQKSSAQNPEFSQKNS